MPSDLIYNGNISSFNELSEDTSCEVLVIGGGVCGLLCAHYLREAGIDVLLTEADTVASSTTARSTAVVTVGQNTLIHDIAKRKSPDEARKLLLARAHALEEYRTLCKKIGAKHEERDFYLYSSEKPSKIMHEYEELKQMEVDAALVNEMPIGIRLPAIKFGHQLQLDPIDFCARIAKDLNIREKTRVTSLTENGAEAISSSGKYKINAKRVIIATHFPLPKLRGLYFLKLYQNRSYVMGLEGVKDIGGAYEDISENGVYMRMYGKYLLLGGGDHRTGKSGGGLSSLMRYRCEHFEGSKIRTTWATQDTETLDGLPYIGRLTRNDEKNLVATGFGGNGFIGSMISAELLRDIILEKKNDFTSLFSPSRSMLSEQLFKNIGSTITTYLIPTTRRCPHLGCALVWNRAECTWDCPCHGSRFSKTGELINGPAQRGMRR
ncbi:MAG: FAD-dependent oxidoreductase [Clostridia bacterium]|nr:FAD-dependent oxidoreductase [Clostridia bacterium]